MIPFQFKKIIIYIPDLVSSLEKFWRNIQTRVSGKWVGGVVGTRITESRGLSHLSHTFLNAYFFIYKNNKWLLSSGEKF